MAITPATYNMIVQRRSYHELTMTLKQSNGTGYSLTGKTVTSQIWDKDRTSKLTDVTITPDSDQTTNPGEFKWIIPSNKTALMTSPTYHYDVLVDHTDGDGVQHLDYWLQGTITTSEGYTAS
tara:strand:+ start:183 stop:548 length:366 start_codon:yes stop_codon:yes gene_type:complete